MNHELYRKKRGHFYYPLYRALRPFVPLAIHGRIRPCTATGVRLLRRCEPWLRRLLAKYRRYPRRHFVILATPRSGTNFLGSLLNSHPELWVLLGEPLSQRSLKLAGVRDGPQAALEQLVLCLNSLPSRYSALKLMAADLDHASLTPEEIVQRFEEVKFLVLYRKDLLSQYVSLALLRAGAPVSSRSRPADYRQGMVKVSVDVHDLARTSSYYRQSYDRWRGSRALNRRALWLSYEELSANPQLVCSQRIFPFLGVEDCQVFSDLEKLTSEPLQEYITNYAEIRSVLENMPLVYEPPSAESALVSEPQKITA